MKTDREGTGDCNGTVQGGCSGTLQGACSGTLQGGCTVTLQGACSGTVCPPSLSGNICPTRLQKCMPNTGACGPAGAQNAEGRLSEALRGHTACGNKVQSKDCVSKGHGRRVPERGLLSRQSAFVYRQAPKQGFRAYISAVALKHRMVYPEPIW